MVTRQSQLIDKASARRVITQLLDHFGSQLRRIDFTAQVSLTIDLTDLWFTGESYRLSSRGRAHQKCWKTIRSEGKRCFIVDEERDA